MKIYLAIPYSGVEEHSFEVANKIAAKLMAEGHIVYSPITHNHPIAKAHGLPTGWDFWERFDTEFIKWCDAVYVVILKDKTIEKVIYSPRGVKIVNYIDIQGGLLTHNSKGVQAEIKIANSLNKPVNYIYE